MLTYQYDFKYHLWFWFAKSSLALKHRAGRDPKSLPRCRMCYSKTVSDSCLFCLSLKTSKEGERPASKERNM